jgi:hypothetical protein
MKLLILFSCFTLTSIAFAGKNRPAAYKELIDYVIQAPDQGETNTCLFQGTTGVMEILLNKKYGLKNQRPGDRFDLAEQFLMWERPWRESKSFFENALLKFNWGNAIHASHLPFEARRADGSVNNSVWNYPSGYEDLPRMKPTGVKTERLFMKGNRWSTYVVTEADIESVKQALWTTKSPILLNYNDEGYWHVVVIVGYDDNAEGACYDTPQEECEGDIGAFYIRDSFGVSIEVRDYDWFRVKANAAFTTQEVSLSSLDTSVQK